MESKLDYNYFVPAQLAHGSFFYFWWSPTLIFYFLSQSIFVLQPVLAFAAQECESVYKAF